MRRVKNIKPTLRAISIVAVIMIIISGVTFAVLQSQQATLTGSSIQTATADLRISHDGTNYSSRQDGFDFQNIIPGDNAKPEDSRGFMLENYGSTPLSLRFAVTSTPDNASNIDLSKVTIVLTSNAYDYSQQIQRFTLRSLVDAKDTGGVPVTSLLSLHEGQPTVFTLGVEIAPDAAINTSASLNDIDFAFSGVAQSI